MTETILVPLDGSVVSEQVLPLALKVAHGLHASVHLVTVIDECGRSARQLEDANEVAGTYLAGVTAPLAGAAVNVTACTVAGVPVDAILTEAIAQGAGLIAMSTHARSAVATWVLGSTAEQIVQRTHVPVMLYHPRRAEDLPLAGFDVVLAPLDGSAGAEAALPLAKKLALALRSRLMLVQVAQGHALSPMWTAYHKTGYADAEQYLASISRRVSDSGLAVERRVLIGDAATELLTLASRTPRALVVMSSHGRKGFSRAVLGSVTMELVRHASQAVVVIHPDTVALTGVA